MKKILFFAALGMSTLAFSQTPATSSPYPYFAYGVANGGSAYSVPDATTDEIAELTLTAGQKFTKFDLTVATAPSTPTGDRDKTFGNNNTAPSASNLGQDQDRGWVTTTLPDAGYYHIIRQIGNTGSGAYAARDNGLWAYHTVNFTEAAKFNPILRFRDGSKINKFVVSVFSPSDMTTPLYNEEVDLTGATGIGVTSNDGKAKYLTLVGPAGSSGSVWYKINSTFTAPAAGNYIVKISQTTLTGSVGFGSFTFWKEAAAVAPEVLVTAPMTNSVYTEGSTIALSAKTTAGDGTISGVEFFDGATSVGMGTDAGGGVYTKDIVAGAGKIYNFKAVVTETGGVAPDKGESVILKAMSIANAEDNFNGTTYPGKPWNNTRWMFGTDNTANYAIGGAYNRSDAVDKFQGVPFFAYDLGAVNNTWDKSSTSLRYVAGSSTIQPGTVGVDARLANMGTNVFTFSDTYSRDATTTGASRFLGSSTNYAFSAGGAWARYSSKFAAGKYKLIVRSTSNCNGNFNIYARFLNADGTVIGSALYTFNGGTIATGCLSELNVTKLTGIPAYSVLTTPPTAATTTQWVMMNDELSLDGDVIVELSDPDPTLGGSTGGAGVFGEFTFEYTGALSTADFTAIDFKVYADNKILNVVADSTEEAVVTVFDINGKQIVSKPLVNGAMSTEIATSGIYIVKMQAKGKNPKTTKVIVK